jgi:hypothetical protein
VFQNNTPKNFRMSKARIIEGPCPMELSMWGMISFYVFRVAMSDKIIQLNIHCQKLTPFTGTSFTQVAFRGYDLFTGRKVSCSWYKTNSLDGELGKIEISKTQARDTETARIYGPSGKRLRKIPLAPFLEKLRTLN